MRLFNEVSPESVKDLLSACPIRSLRRGEVLIEAGQPNDAVYLLLAGQLHVHLDSVKNEPVATLEAGETVGELSVMDQQPTSAVVVATKNSRLLVVPRETFWRLIQASHGVAANLLSILAQRLRQNNTAIRRQEEQIQLLFESTGEAIYAIDLAGKCVLANPACLSLLGYEHADELIGKNMHRLTHRNHTNGKASRLKDCRICAGLKKQKANHSDDEILCRKDGTRFSAECWSSLIYRDGEVVGSAITFIDITERKRKDAERLKLSRAIEQAADAVIITDNKGVIEYLNPAFEKTTGYNREETLGQKPSLLNSGTHDESFWKRLWETIQEGRVFRDVVVNRRKNGHLYYEEKTITPLTDSQGNITHFISTGKDITDHVHAQERLEHLTHHDALTDAPNRNVLMDHLNESMTRARLNDRLVALLFLDLDRFKVINDTLSHDTGDQILQSVFQRLKKCVRHSDTVARLGGDEFAILLTHIAQTSDIAPIAQQILDALCQPLQLGEHEVFVTASMGISIYPYDGDETGILLQHADIAMHQAKDRGKNNYQFYTTEMNTRSVGQLNLESALRRGLERREFLIHYQPQVDLQSGRIVGVEALIRWQHPERGLVSPAEFIPLLEETGLIVPVGEWVLQSACEQARAWEDAGISPTYVSVNLSARQFGAASFLAVVDQLRKEARLDARLLELEITESVLMQEGDNSLQTLEALQAMGIRIAIDDFGTGYSSLAYLKRFPIHTLKIDRTFIKDLPRDRDDAAIVTAVISLARGLGLNVVAEGVETAEQLRFLRSRSCDTVQGFIFSKPLPAEEMTQLLLEGKQFGPFELAAPNRTGGTAHREALD
ncbi:MAG: EAL domain-containing protein [Acidiferrobacterales bacterium]